MTEERLKQESEIMVERCTPYHVGSFVQGFIAGAEPREKRIEELEQKLEQTEKDLADYQFNYPKIKELEEENNKLLDVINNQDVKNADLEKKLEQAKDIIKKFLSLRHDCKEKDCPCESLICETIDERAEQFLKEIEK